MKAKLFLFFAVCLVYSITASATTIIMSGSLTANKCKQNDDGTSTFTVSCASGRDVCSTITINDGRATIIYCSPVINEIIPVGMHIFNDSFSGIFMGYDCSTDESGIDSHNWTYLPFEMAPPRPIYVP